MAEVYKAALVQRVGFCLTVIHRSGTGSLESTLCIESDRSLKFVAEHAPAAEMSAEEAAKVKEAEKFEADFDQSMDDDFNTADAIAAVFDLVKYANTNVTEDSSRAFAEAMRAKIQGLCDVLGVAAERTEELLDADIEKLIEERQAARKARNFARADEIRSLLLEKGILLEDTREGVKWKRA